MLPTDMQRRFSLHRIALLFGLFTFGAAVYTDAYLRENKGPTCFGCSNRICLFIEYVDNPSIVIAHPLQGAEELIFINDFEQ